MSGCIYPVAFVAVVTLVAAAAFALLLYRGVGKPVVGIVLTGIGLYVYHVPGWFEGFLPLFLVAAISGSIVLYEWALETSIDPSDV